MFLLVFVCGLFFFLVCPFVALVVLSGFAQSIAQIEKAKRNYFETEFARSLLEEYIATYPQSNATGSSVGGYTWKVTEEELPPIATTEFDHLVKVMEIAIHLKCKGCQNHKRLLAQAVVRKR